MVRFSDKESYEKFEIWCQNGGNEHSYETMSQWCKTEGITCILLHISNDDGILIQTENGLLKVNKWGIVEEESGPFIGCSDDDDLLEKMINEYLWKAEDGFVNMVAVNKTIMG